MCWAGFSLIGGHPSSEFAAMFLWHSLACCEMPICQILVEAASLGESHVLDPESAQALLTCVDRCLAAKQPG